MGHLAPVQWPIALGLGASTQGWWRWGQYMVMGLWAEVGHKDDGGSLELGMQVLVGLTAHLFYWHGESRLGGTFGDSLEKVGQNSPSPIHIHHPPTDLSMRTLLFLY